MTEPISNTALSSFLTQRFGPLKDLEIVRSKACAFLEFISLDSAKRAIAASLPQSQGGEGGIWIDVGAAAGEGNGNIRISVETKKERGERPVGRPRGGAPPSQQQQVNGDGGNRGGGGGGGGYRGGRGGQGGRGGRGGPPPTGNK